VWWLSASNKAVNTGYIPRVPRQESRVSWEESSHKSLYISTSYYPQVRKWVPHTGGKRGYKQPDHTCMHVTMKVFRKSVVLSVVSGVHSAARAWAHVAFIGYSVRACTCSRPNEPCSTHTHIACVHAHGYVCTYTSLLWSDVFTPASDVFAGVNTCKIGSSTICVRFSRAQSLVAQKHAFKRAPSPQVRQNAATCRD